MADFWPVEVAERLGYAVPGDHPAVVPCPKAFAD